MAKIKAINPRRARAKFVVRQLRESSKEVISAFGDNIAGFALVSWDMCGDGGAVYCSKDGPIGDALVPDYARTMLLYRLINKERI